MNLLHIQRTELARYVRRQLRRVCPMPPDPQLALIDAYLDTALVRLDRCVSQVCLWKPGQFDVLHSSQYCIFLYYLANTIWQHEQARGVCTQLFLLNKALNAIDCFYEVELPEVFFIGHSVGIVLAKASYANHLVLYQNTTVGKNHGIAPSLGEGVILYPNTAVIGRCNIGAGSVVSQGVSVVNQDTPAGHLVFQGARGKLVCQTNSKNILADFFRDV